MFRTSRKIALVAALAATVAMSAPAIASVGDRWITVDRQGYGQWGYSEQYNTGTGSTACEVTTAWPNGREMRLVMFSEPRSLALVYKDPVAGMRGRGRGVVTVDGGRWMADFEAVGDQLAIAHISNVQAAGRFLEAFAGGDEMGLALPWGQRVAAGLRGSQAALARMNRCVGRMM